MLTPEQERWMVSRREMHDAAIASVKSKLASGEYALENQPCFCGANDDKELKTLDRFGIPHRVVVCQACALVRANPRPTAEAYRRFYNEEYRNYLYRWLDRPVASWAEEFEAIREREHRRGEKLHKGLIDEDIEFPSTVIDIGCYRGGALDYFKEKGAETWGVEFNDDARSACAERGHGMAATIDELIARGVKADLVVMHDVIEHLLDPSEMWKIKDVLKPDGHLYVFTPGLFRTDPRHYWQLAHTWYFVANTLRWMMDRIGFVPSYIDEDISAFFQYQGPGVVDAPPPQEWVEYIVDEAEGREERRLPPFAGICKFPKKLLYDNMRRNYAMKINDLYELVGTKRGPIAIVGGGPSIDDQIDTLANLKRSGVPIITIARMYPWCLEHGITPDYVVSLDCSEEQEKGFATISTDTTHLMSAVTRPELIEKVLAAEAPVYIFDSRDDRKIKKLRREAGYETCIVVNSGGTVVITAMALALTLGYSDFHIFGFDCMFPDIKRFHAQGIAGQSVEQRVLTVNVAGEVVLTTPSFIEFARQALDLFSVAHEAGSLETVKIYGESIVQKMWPDMTWHDEEVAA